MNARNSNHSEEKISLYGNGSDFRYKLKDLGMFVNVKVKNWIVVHLENQRRDAKDFVRTLLDLARDQDCADSITDNAHFIEVDE